MNSGVWRRARRRREQRNLTHAGAIRLLRIPHAPFTSCNSAALRLRTKIKLGAAELYRSELATTAEAATSIKGN